MSLVPTNTKGWTVVLHDPDRGAIVLYDKSSRQVSVIQHDAFTTNADATRGIQSYDALGRNEGMLTLSNENIATVCSTCGQILPEGSTTHHDAPEEGDNEDGDEAPHGIGGHSFLEYVAQMRGAANSSHGGTSSPIVDANYFKLLDDIPSRGVKISKSAFSEGYYDRFFKTKALLGKGSRGSVYLVEHVLDGVSLGLFALKKVPVGDDREWLEKVLAEVHLLRMLTHPNLVSYNYVWLETSSTSKFVPSVPCAFILQAYCNGGTLEDYINKTGVWKPDSEEKAESKRERIRRLSGLLEPTEKELLSPVEILSFMLDVSRGVKHLHAHQIIHRDLKPSNCLLNLSDTNGSEATAEVPTALVSDFGEGQMEGTMRAGTGSTGTLEYCAPELLIPKNGQLAQFSKRTDIFSLGMIFYYLCFSTLPYPEAHFSDERENLKAMIDEVKSFKGIDQAYNSSEFRQDLPPVIYELMKRMLSRVPEERPSADDIVAVLENISLTTVFGEPPSTAVTRSPLLITGSTVNLEPQGAVSRMGNMVASWNHTLHINQNHQYLALKTLLISIKIVSILKYSNQGYQLILTLLVGIELPLRSYRQTLLMFLIHGLVLTIASCSSWI